MSDRAKELMDSGEGPSVLNKARSLVSGDAQFFSLQPNMDQLRKQLDSESLPSKKEAMKRVVAQISLGTDMSPLFPNVVKNIHCPSIELRKLIYHFILQYCDERPNEALLSISAFQSDLVDKSMHVRALALRTLSSIRIPAIHPVVMIAIKKCSSDIAPLVRRSAATAISKACTVSRGDEDRDLVISLLGTLMGDRSMDVVAAAALAFEQVCPDRYDLVHRHFRRICRALLECDEWGQSVLIQLLLRYARLNFVDPDAKKGRAARAVQSESDSGSDSDSDSSDADSVMGGDLQLDSDHHLLLQSVKPLLGSLNRGVVTSVVSLYYHCAPAADLDVICKPLLRLLNGPADGHYVTLLLIQSVVARRAKPFVPYVRDFFITPGDAPVVRELKLRLIARLVTRDNSPLVMAEYKTYLRSFEVGKVTQTVQGLALLAVSLPELTPAVTRLILPLLSHCAEGVVTEAVIALRQLVVQSGDKVQCCRIIRRLVSRIMKGTLTAAAARSSVLWLVGENIRAHPDIATIAPDVFRLFVKTFTSEQSLVKHQVLTLGTKIWLNLEGEGDLAARFKAMFFYLLELVRFDEDFDIRDHGRMVETTLDRESPGFAVMAKVALGAKPLPEHADGATVRGGFLLGSMSFIMGGAVSGYRPLPEWAEKIEHAVLRAPADARSSSTSSSDYTESSDYTDSETASDSPSPSDSGSDSATDSSDSEEDAPAPARPAPRGPVKVMTRVVATKKIAAPAAAAGTSRVADEMFKKKAGHVDPANE